MVGDGPSRAPRARRRRRRRARSVVDGAGASSSTARKVPMVVVPPPTDFDTAYFHAYANTGIHEDMIKAIPDLCGHFFRDRVRTETYKSAVNRYQNAIVGKVVMDVGCGTGILAIFCALVGARKVYAVDASAIANQAKDVVRENNLSDKITVLHGRVEDVNIDEKVDVIISEWMGYMLLHETMLPSVIFARDKWLRPGGFILPSHATLFMAPVTHTERYRESIDFWRDVYGINMSAIMPLAKQCEFEEPCIETISGQNVLTWPLVVKDVDCYTVTVKELESVTAKFRFSSMLNAPLHGFAFWFEAVFGRPAVYLASDSSPDQQPLTGPIVSPSIQTQVASGSSPNQQLHSGLEVSPSNQKTQVASVSSPDQQLYSGPMVSPSNQETQVASVSSPNQQLHSGPEFSPSSQETQVVSGSSSDQQQHSGSAVSPSSQETQVVSESSPDQKTHSGPVVSPSKQESQVAPRSSPNQQPHSLNQSNKRLRYEEIVLSTAPEDAFTHWQQTLIYMYNPIELEQDQIIEGSVTLSQSQLNIRFLNIIIKFSTGGQSFVKECIMR